MNRNDIKCIEWGYRILDVYGLSDWTIQWKPSAYREGIAIFDTKTIHISWPNGEPDYPLMLHEICHPVTHKINGEHGHDSEFAHQYMYMIKKYFTVKDELF